MKATAQGVRDLLEQVGPLATAEVATFFPDTRYQDVAAIMSNMRKRLATKRVYICEWTREIGQGKSYLRPVYALGSKPDARKPSPVSNSKKCQRWREKQRIPKINSVWSLAKEMLTLRVNNKSKSVGIKAT